LALGHEIAHIRRRDLVWSAIAWIVRTALFFNPVAWLAERELRAAQETATDQETVWITGASVFAYGEMLLRAMSSNTPAARPTGLAMFDSFRNAHRRLSAMRHFSQRPHKARKAITAIFIAVGIGCLPTYLLVPATATTLRRQDATTKHRTSQSQSAAKSGPELAKKPAPLYASLAVKKEKPLAKSEKVRRTESGVSRTRFLNFPVDVTSPAGPHAPKAPQAPPSRPGARVTLVSENVGAESHDEGLSGNLDEVLRKAQQDVDAQMADYIQRRFARIAEFREATDRREQEARQRESDSRQRQRDRAQRAQAIHQRELAIEERIRNDYKSANPNQREIDAHTRDEDRRQIDADRFQDDSDKKQLEEDKKQIELDKNSLAEMTKDAWHDIAEARSTLQKRQSEFVAKVMGLRREAAAAAYLQAHRKPKTFSGSNAAIETSGPSSENPTDFESVNAQNHGGDSPPIVLEHRGP
jgi:hypothetical protein